MPLVRKECLHAEGQSYTPADHLSETEINSVANLSVRGQ